MKKVLLAGSALVAAMSIASAAQAADASPVTYNWTGLYVGGNAGVSWNNSSVNNSFAVNSVKLNDVNNNIDGDQAAFTAGGILGYNYQIDQVVLGAETDFNYLGFGSSGKRTGTLDHVGDTYDLTASGSLDANWFGTIRGRLGFAVDNLLIYGTGGAAYGHVNGDGKLTASMNGTDLASWKGSYDATNWGWTVGGGAEYGIDNWSFGVEYLYVDLGSGNWKDNSNSDANHNFDLKGNADYAFSTVRASVKYRFYQ